MNEKNDSGNVTPDISNNNINPLTGPKYPRAPPIMSNYRGEMDNFQGNRITIKHVFSNENCESKEISRNIENPMSYSYDGGLFKSNAHRSTIKEFTINPEWVSEYKTYPRILNQSKSHSETNCIKYGKINQNLTTSKNHKRQKNITNKTEEESQESNSFYFGCVNSYGKKPSNPEWPKRCRSVPASKYRNPITWCY